MKLGHRAIDITGQKFGRLTAISVSHTEKGKGLMWNCLCDCGNTTVKAGKRLRIGNVKSCGCMISEDLIGRKFGKLTVVKRLKTDKNDMYNWECICDCGGKKITNTTTLKTGLVKSCGCMRWSDCCGDISLSFFNKIKRRAKSKGQEFNISIEYIWQLFLNQNKKCALSGLDIDFFTGFVNKDKKNTNEKASLDRIDSTKGYIEGNVQWVHKDVNRMKMDLGEDYFYKLCQAVTGHITFKKSERSKLAEVASELLN